MIVYSIRDKDYPDVGLETVDPLDNSMVDVLAWGVGTFCEL